MSRAIRNFCIISHIDHGKSTLADRFLELTKTVPKEKMHPQYLDLMDLEREKGITIKLQPVTMNYTLNANPYTLNLIDTPGHVDFSYEVSRSLACVEGAILLVDASQGIQAQTLANLNLALEQNLKIIPVINKIDLKEAMIEESEDELAKLLKIDKKEILKASAKLGTGVEEILEEIIKKISPPKGKKDKSLKTLIFDSLYDEYKGVIVYIRVFEGEIKRGEKIRFLATNKEAEVIEVGIFKPQREEKERLEAGEIGYIATGLKELEFCRVGDTIVKSEIRNPKFEIVELLPGYKEIKPMVFAGIYLKRGEYEELRKAMGKLKLNDASLVFEPESSSSLGLGFRVGCLGLLHLEIVKERLKREYNLEIIVTTPSVAYKIGLKGGKEKIIKNALEIPEVEKIDFYQEPWFKLKIITPSQFLGNIMKLLEEKRAIYKGMIYLTEEKIILDYEIPLTSILENLYDKIKSVSSGFATLDYEFLEYRKADLVKIDILVAGEKFEALSIITHKDEAYHEGKRIVESLKNLLPRQLFEVKIQAAIGKRIIASEKLPALRKDVLAKLYGGDVTRKKKLLEKQKKGKKKLKALGKVDIPEDVFFSLLK